MLRDQLRIARILALWRTSVVLLLSVLAANAAAPWAAQRAVRRAL